MAQKHVLAVDDDPTMRELIANYLTDHGFRVSTAAGGEEMGRILAEDPVDLVVLDLQLAQEDGLQLVNELRTRSTLPIIVITGHWRDEVDRIVGLELGADDYLTKPFNLRELLARVRAVLRRVGAAQAAPPVDGKATRYRFCRLGAEPRRAAPDVADRNFGRAHRWRVQPADGISQSAAAGAEP